MTHFLNTVLMQNAEWPLKGWVRAYAWACRRLRMPDETVNVARQSMCRDSATHVNVTGRILRIRESVLEKATPLSLHLRSRTMFVCLAMYWPLRHVFTVSW
jgi:hypothetical protein